MLRFCMFRIETDLLGFFRMPGQNMRRRTHPSDPSWLPGPKVVKTSPVIKPPSSNIPEIVFANDGRKFFPCMYCCRAFAYKKGQVSHMKACLRAKTLSMTGSRQPMQVPKYEPKYVKEERPKRSSMYATVPVKEEVTEPLVVMENNSTAFKNCAVAENMNKLMQNKSITIKTVSHNPNAPNKSEQDYICYLCGLVCKNLAIYTAHRKSHVSKMASDDLQKYADMYQNAPEHCPICNREQKGGKQAWLRHLEIHSATPKYFCKVCNKGFGRSDHRNDHERRH